MIYLQWEWNVRGGGMLKLQLREEEGESKHLLASGQCLTNWEYWQKGQGHEVKRHFHSVTQNSRKHHIWRKKNPLFNLKGSPTRSTKCMESTREPSARHSSWRPVPRCVRWAQKLHSLRPYTSLESDCNAQGARGHPSVRKPDHTVNSPTKLTWW